MQNLQITKQIINNREVNSIDARNLYEKLEVQSKFADWIKNRLKDFQENLDFIVSKNLESVNTGFSKINYTLTLETAKHIAMIERNEQGKKIRQYFIDFEEKAKQFIQQQNQITINSTFLLQLANEMKAKEEEIARLEDKTQEQEIIINTQDKTIKEISNTEETYSFRHTAKKLNISESDLRDVLLRFKLINYNSSAKKYLPTQKALNSSYAKYITRQVKDKYFEEIRYTNKFIERYLKNKHVINSKVL